MLLQSVVQMCSSSARATSLLSRKQAATQTWTSRAFDFFFSEVVNAALGSLSQKKKTELVVNCNKKLTFNPKAGNA